MSALLQFLNGFFEKIFVNKQATTLVITLFILAALFYLYSAFLMPLLLAGGVTYTLNGPLTYLHNKKIPKKMATTIVFSLFLCIFFLLLLAFPFLLREATTLIGELINIMSSYSSVEKILENNPAIIGLATDYGFDIQEIDNTFNVVIQSLSSVGTDLLTIGVTSVFKELTLVLSLLVYLVVLPILVFYMMWDSENIGEFLKKYTSSNEKLSQSIWVKMDAQMSLYIRGKVFEILLVSITSFILFFSFSLNYSLLLAILSGLSTIIPVVGATIVTIPILIVAGLQFGFSTSFAAVSILYLILQFLDGYVLVPKLFSEVMKLHPLVILGSVFLFGGIWGFWGAFFAVPIATFVKVLLDSWPSSETP